MIRKSILHRIWLTSIHSPLARSCMHAQRTWRRDNRMSRRFSPLCSKQGLYPCVARQLSDKCRLQRHMALQSAFRGEYIHRLTNSTGKMVSIKNEGVIRYFVSCMRYPAMVQYDSNCDVAVAPKRGFLWSATPCFTLEAAQKAIQGRADTHPC